MAASVVAGSDAYDSGRAPVVTIGNFDGVHRGHRRLIDLCCERAREQGVPAAVYTFDPAPRDVIRPDNGIPRVQRLVDKVARLGAAGIDDVIVEHFTLAFAQVTPEFFARTILGERLGATELVVGWDFRYGQRRAGTVEMLQEWLPIPVHQVGPLTDDRGDVISSSRIRMRVREGLVEEAAMLLGQPHEVVGLVVTGDGRGRTIGVPTANLDVETPLIPRNGVYAVRALISDRWVDGVANIGARPTFASGFSVEVHLLDFTGDLYGQLMRVAFVSRLRDEIRFDSASALVAQIHADILAARAVL